MANIRVHPVNLNYREMNLILTMISGYNVDLLDKKKINTIKNKLEKAVKKAR